MAIKIGIHNGDNTHNQLQLITLHNFNMINAINNNPLNPIPAEFSLAMLFLFIG